MIVLDASAAVEILLRLGKSEALMDRVFAEGEKLAAPELLDVEVTQVVRRYFQKGEISAARGATAVTDLVDLPIQRFAHMPLIERVWQLRNNLTAYDATYVALAEALDAPIITCDKAIAAAAGIRANVELY